MSFVAASGRSIIVAGLEKNAPADTRQDGGWLLQVSTSSAKGAAPNRCQARLTFFTSPTGPEPYL